MMLNKNNEDNSLVLQAEGPQDDEEDSVHNNREASNGSNLDDDNDKHHVGPVMGIFFKVWSLVKGESPLSFSSRDEERFRHNRLTAIIHLLQ